jgi:hypothetical protein
VAFQLCVIGFALIHDASAMLLTRQSRNFVIKTELDHSGGRQSHFIFVV